MIQEIQEGNDKKKKGKKKFLLIAFLLLLPVLVAVGVVAAYFSDVSQKFGQITTGKLKINGIYQVFVNGAEIEGDINISNLNPGDVIVINGDITNVGNKSAWVREKVNFDFSNPVFSDYLKVYIGTQSQQDLLENVDLTEFEINLSGGAAVTDSFVINGTGNDAEIEDEGEIFLGSNNYNFSYTIYFSHLAGNDMQGQDFSFSVITQAIQYRNNTAEPDENAWATVTAAPNIVG